jgi:hypothetical protein
MTDHWASFLLTPKEIYEQLTRGKGADSLIAEQSQTDDERRLEGERAEMIRLLANAVKSGWQGEASDGAYGAAMPLAERAVENSTKLMKAQDLLSRQIGSFHRAVNSVVPVSDPPEMSVDEAFPFDVDHDKAVREYQDAAQNNIAVYRDYDGASNYNETNLPQEYRGYSRDGGDVSVKGGDTIKVGEPGPGISEPRQSWPGDSGPYSGGPYPGGEPDGPYPGGSSDRYPGGPTGGPDGSQTSPNDFRPGTASATYPMPTYPASGKPSPVSGGFVGGVPVGGYSGGGEGGPGSASGPVGGRGPGESGPGSGVRGPLGSGALAAEEAAAARRAAQAAAGTRTGGPIGAPMGAGRNKDDEDSEHQRKVLIEADAEETFGSDVLTAPQVIGDDEYEDD